MSGHTCPSRLRSSIAHPRQSNRVSGFTIVNSSTVDILGQISRNFIFHHFWKRGLRISGVESTESNSDPARLSTIINGRDFLPTNTMEWRFFDRFGSDIGARMTRP